MPITSTLNLDSPRKWVEYPVLARHINFDLVVLFTEERKGVVVVPGGANDLGDALDYWIPVSNKDEWVILPRGAKVEITQA